MRYFEVGAEIEIEVRHKRLAEDSEEAKEFSRRALRNAVANALQEELSNGESSIEIEIGDTREVPDAW